MFTEPLQINKRGSGWIEVISGSMFSGKTEELLRRLKRAIIADQKIIILKPSVDNRYSKTKVVSHDANAMTSVVVEKTGEILHRVTDEEVIGIDEAQFFDAELVDICTDLAYRGKRVIVAGLDMDYKGKPFDTISQLLACAEYITKVHAICAECGNPAQFSFRTSNKKERIVIGEKEAYKPLCRGCYDNQTEKNH